ncbi:glycosyltransferase [Xanthomonas sp. 1678]|uniref:glycosyltransferase n=1 Tax=Xanthomonas sp. 1678 TaxID=3158788 RepID=UPI0028644E86|nr:glycosyltransferase involved in cell wall biosynthesis [Xanthomonas translucens]
MSSAVPRVLVISQWPKIKNAEYELIEKMRKTGYPITVVDFLGFDVATGKCINDVHLPDKYDFAISFHYDTPKFLNLRTFLWVANPLEFMHFQSNYRINLIQHLRAYDGYLFNGSALLKEHIRQVLGSEWQDKGLSLIGSASRSALVPPHPLGGAAAAAEASKVFYCGVNWERGSGKSGRAQGLLDVLQERGIADFYGPRKLEGIDPWAGFTSYRGEIPFDGVSMFETMRQYGAVLAVSSPAHLKSRTASGRVFEGLVSGTPVISDRNPHVIEQFGDLVYYFSGETEQERANAIQAALNQILADPEEANRRVRAAQKLIAEEYSFETKLDATLAAIKEEHHAALAAADAGVVVDVVLIDHDPWTKQDDDSGEQVFPNLTHILRAAAELQNQSRHRVRITVRSPRWRENAPADKPTNVEFRFSPPQGDEGEWNKQRLGSKLFDAAGLVEGDYAVFFNQLDFPQYDYFEKALDWSLHVALKKRPTVFVSGFFVNAFKAEAPASAGGILRNSSSVGLYRWTQDSIAEHQLGTLFFSREALATLDLSTLVRFDILLALALVLRASDADVELHRSRHLTLRENEGYFHHYNAMHMQVAAKGFWALQYDMPTNFSHEINALYDAFHESPAAVAVADKLSGHGLPATPVIPGMDRFNYFAQRVRPFYVVARKIWHVSGLSWLNTRLRHRK